MRHSLQQHIDRIRRRARRQMWVRGIAGLLLVAVVTLLLLGWLDYLLRPEASWGRLPLTLTALAALIGAVAWFLWTPLRVDLSDLEIARQVQRRFPKLGDRLASALEFLSRDEHDRLAGSPALRRAVVVEAMSATNDLPLEQTVATRHATRMLIFLIIAGVIAGVFVAVNPSTASRSIARLTNPWNDQRWPRRHELEFVSPPSSIASGGLFEVELQDRRGELPENVWIDYRLTKDEGERIVTESMQYSDGLMLAHRDNVRNSFSYRARGGDDQSMEWLDLQIVEPPQVETLSIAIAPPNYSGWPSTPGEGRLAALAGSVVTLRGKASKPLAAAYLHWPGEEEPRRIAAQLASDGLGFSFGHATAGDHREATPILAEHSGSYWLELVDRQQVQSEPTRWPLRVIADEPPRVTIDQPLTELFVTAEATIPLTLTARDHLGIHVIALQYLRGDQSDRGQQTIELYSGPDEAPRLTAKQVASLLQNGAQLEERRVEYRWQLAELSLPPGTQITINGTATDYRPQTGVSPLQRINIITPGELEDRIARRQNFVLGELTRVLKLTIEARARTAALEIQIRETGKLGPLDVDQLQGLELTHRDIRRSLVSETEGVKHHIQSLLAELDSNKVDSPEIARRLRELDAVIDRLEAGPLDSVGRQLTDAIKNAATANRIREEQNSEEPNATDQFVLKSMEGTAESQDQIIAALQAQLGDLEQLNNYRQFARDIGAMQREGEAIRRATEELQNRTLGRDINQLSPQDRADLAKLGQRQLEVARGFEKLRGRMDRAANELSETDPLTATSIRDAIDHAGDADIAGKMRTAAAGLRRNQIGQSLSEQAATAKSLEQMLNILSNRRENELDRLVKKLKEAETELKGLRERQTGLRKKFEEAKEFPKEEQGRELQRLAREQKQIQEQMQRLARQLKRLRAERAGDSLQRASGGAGQANDAGQQGDADDAAAGAQAAERDLEEAEQQLTQARQQAEQDLAAERLARMQDELQGLLDRQRGLLHESERLEGLRQSQGQLTRGQFASVTDLAMQQNMLAEESTASGEELAAAEVFRFALLRAAEQMQAAVIALNQLQTAEPVQQPQRTAIEQLQLVLQALQPDEDSGEDEPPPGPGAGQGPGNSQQGDGIQAIAAIRLLKLMQQQINKRTNLLHERQAEGRSLSLAEAEQLQQLVADQGELAKMAFRLLTKPEQADPADNPDQLPEIEPENEAIETTDSLLNEAIE